jgi:hypothetical protein
MLHLLTRLALTSDDSVFGGALEDVRDGKCPFADLSEFEALVTSFMSYFLFQYWLKLLNVAIRKVNIILCLVKFVLFLHNRLTFAAEVFRSWRSAI